MGKAVCYSAPVWESANGQLLFYYLHARRTSNEQCAFQTSPYHNEECWAVSPCIAFLRKGDL